MKEINFDTKMKIIKIKSYLNIWRSAAIVDYLTNITFI